MNERDLRIGNYVLMDDYSDEIFSISTIDYSDFGYWVNAKGGKNGTWINNIDLVKPILLTEEWLLKFGFKKREQGVCDYFFIGMNEITHDWLFDLVWLKNIHGGFEDFPFYRNGKFKIKSVHHLQNLYFALTGEELILNDDL